MLSLLSQFISYLPKPIKSANTDTEKVNLILKTIETETEISDTDFTRIGKPRSDNTARPILVTLPYGNSRTEILRNSDKLRSAGRKFSGISMRRDSHPAIRKEWRRLFQAEVTEQNKKENRRHTIQFDIKARKLMKDDEVIDSWQLINFNSYA